MSTERVLITVKTYPTLSSKYDEVVCTAGFRENGTWIRIYPVPFRKYDEYQQYKKFQWVELGLDRNTNDKRSESYRPTSEIKLLDEMGTENQWYQRRKFILEDGHVFTNLSEIIDLNKQGKLSLATFKPTEIVKIIVKHVSRDWDKVKLDAVIQRSKQNSLFEDVKKDFTVVNKLPYVFKYEFKDDEGITCKLMIEDWEIGALYWNLFKKYNDESRAIEGVKNKYMNDLIIDRDIHFFLGTTLAWDARAPNPFVITGVFSPPLVLQDELF